MKSGSGKQIYTLFLSFTSAVVPFTASVKNKGNNIIISKILNWEQKIILARWHIDSRNTMLQALILCPSKPQNHSLLFPDMGNTKRYFVYKLYHYNIPSQYNVPSKSQALFYIWHRYSEIYTVISKSPHSVSNQVITVCASIRRLNLIWEITD